MKLRAGTTSCVVGSVLLLITGSCSYPISKQLRDEAQKDMVTFAMVLKNPDAYKGRIVLWGGRIIETTNIKDGTEMIVLETPLDFMGVPAGEQSSRGRFIARSSQFLDPAIYEADREITLAGEVLGAEENRLGKTTYTYPVVMIKELNLWERYYPQHPADYYWYAPFWGPYYYGPGPGYYLGGGHHH